MYSTTGQLQQDVFLLLIRNRMNPVASSNNTRASEVTFVRQKRNTCRNFVSINFPLMFFYSLPILACFRFVYCHGKFSVLGPCRFLRKQQNNKTVSISNGKSSVLKQYFEPSN